MSRLKGELYQYMTSGCLILMEGISSFSLSFSPLLGFSVALPEHPEFHFLAFARQNLAGVHDLIKVEDELKLIGGPYSLQDRLRFLTNDSNTGMASSEKAPGRTSPVACYHG